MTVRSVSAAPGGTLRLGGDLPVHRLGFGAMRISVDQIARARRFFSVASVQNRYNLVERQSEPVLDYCERENIAFVPWYPLLLGRVAERPAVARIASRHLATSLQVALAWLLKRSAIMLPIPGTARVAHLEENVAAASLELSAEELEQLAG